LSPTLVSIFLVTSPPYVPLSIKWRGGIGGEVNS
jgi:hypothetical protein